MDDINAIHPPSAVAPILRQTQALGFQMASEPQTGALLRALAASKPARRFLEIGTGTGYGSAWILDGMDAASSLVSVDVDPAVQAVARQHLGSDPRVSFVLMDALAFLTAQPPAGFDFIFADALPGKFERFDLTLGLLKAGGILVLDDLLPQPSWPENHATKVQQLLAQLDHLPGCQVVKLHWATGIALLTKIG